MKSIFQTTPIQAMVLAFVAGLLVCCQQGAPVAHSGPQPTQGTVLPTPGTVHPGQSAEQEEDNQILRQRWMEEMHRAAPGVDWRAIERQNAREAWLRKQQGYQSPAATQGSWDEVGSRNQAGSTVVAVPSSDDTELYLGSALGGVWRANIDGSNWRAISDQVYGGVNKLLAIPPTSGSQDILLRDAGGGLLRSLDGGQSWSEPSGDALGSTSVKRMLLMRDAQHTILVLARNVGWRLYRSNDRGASFSEVKDLTGYFPDIWTPRHQLGSIYLLDDDRLWRSDDLGSTFVSLGARAQFRADDVHLGGHETSANQTFSVAVKTGGAWELWRTTDAGGSWAYVNDLPGMWNAFATSTKSPKLVAYGGVELWYSRDEGVSFDKVNGWGEYYGDPAGKLHADIMGLSVVRDDNAVNGERWYINCHGGTYVSEDRLRTVQNLSLAGLGVSQYYGTLTSRRDPEVLAVGSQDQGYQWGKVSDPGGLNGPWANLSQLISGDYGHLTSWDGSHDFVYSDYPGFVLVQVGEKNPSLRTVDFPPGFGGQWLPYMTADLTDKKGFYLCGNVLWRYQGNVGGNAWTPVQHSVGSFPAQLSAVAFSKLDPQRAWCCTTTGLLYYSTDGGVNWTQSADTGPGAHYFYGTTIVPSSTKVDEVWVAGSGYSTAGVRFSSDGGVTWRSRARQLPPTLVYCLAEAPDGSGRMYCGTSSGAWEWDPLTKDWSDILGPDAPVTLYWSVETVPANNLVRFGTYGRGVWDYAADTAGFFPYGELRGEPNTLSIGANKQPLLGTTVTVKVSGGLPFATGFLTVCSAADERPDFGGTLFVDLATETDRIALSADASGSASATFNLPGNPALVGVERYLQAVLQDGAKAGGWAMSHGLRARLGDH